MILVVIPGFGPENIELKKKIIKKNIEIIKKSYNDVYIKVFNYGNESCGIECEEIFEKGIVGQFLFNHITPEYVKKFSNIIILLDDIELSIDIDLNKIIKNLEYYNLDIISPILDKTSAFSHNIMVQNNMCDKTKIRLTGFIELFCYIMSIDGYIKWYNLLDKNSCWLWGIDLALYHQGIKCGILEGITMHHHIKGESYNPYLPNPRIEMELNRKKYKFIENIEITNKHVNLIN